MSHSILPKGLRDIYSPFDAVSEQHALVYRTVVAMTLKEVEEMVREQYPELAVKLRVMAHEVRNK